MMASPLQVRDLGLWFDFCGGHIPLFFVSGENRGQSEPATPNGDRQVERQLSGSRAQSKEASPAPVTPLEMEQKPEVLANGIHAAETQERIDAAEALRAPEGEGQGKGPVGAQPAQRKEEVEGSKKAQKDAAPESLATNTTEQRLLEAEGDCKRLLEELRTAEEALEVERGRTQEVESLRRELGGQQEERVRAEAAFQQAILTKEQEVTEKLRREFEQERQRLVQEHQGKLTRVQEEEASTAASAAATEAAKMEAATLTAEVERLRRDNAALKEQVLGLRQALTKEFEDMAQDLTALHTGLEDLVAADTERASASAGGDSGGEAESY